MDARPTRPCGCAIRRTVPRSLVAACGYSVPPTRTELAECGSVRPVGCHVRLLVLGDCGRQACRGPLRQIRLRRAKLPSEQRWPVVCQATLAGLPDTAMADGRMAYTRTAVYTSSDGWSVWGHRRAAPHQEIKSLPARKDPASDTVLFSLMTGRLRSRGGGGAGIPRCPARCRWIGTARSTSSTWSLLRRLSRIHRVRRPNAARLLAQRQRTLVT